MRRINILIFHGTLGNPESNWFPWLKRKLQEDGHNVLVPHFPTPEGQSFDAWRAIAEKNLDGLDPADTILVGHSLSPVFILRLAEQSQKSFLAAFLTAPFMGKLGIEPYDTLNASFMVPPFDWPVIQSNIAEIHCFAGSDDPYVPLSFSQTVAQQAGGDLTVIDKGGHLNTASGMTEFPLLLDKIRHTIAFRS